MLRLAISILLATMANAYGANIKSEILPNGKHVVVVDGDLTQEEDLATFQTLARAAPEGSSVRLRSRGGKIVTGLEMGKLIRQRRFATVVMDDTLCASACALAWLAGAPRVMGKKARIGFHAASINGVETGAGNALVGAYLDRLGLPERAIYFATVAGPKEMSWLTPESAKGYGIDVVPMDENRMPAAPDAVSSPSPRSSPSAQPKPPPHERPGMTLEKAMKEMAIMVRGAWARPSPDWDLLRVIYGERVLFHGKDISADEVIASKKRFAEKWPLRTYSIRQDDTFTASCLRPVNICHVRGIMDWRVRNSSQNKVESGVDTFEYKIRWTGDHYEVLAETTNLITGEPLPSFFASSSFRVAGVDLDDVLNVRNGPSPEHAVIGSILPDADGIRIVGPCVSAWCPIQHRGLSGWVNSFYLKPSP